MTQLGLVIGDKRYSSWSLRPWLVLRHAGLPFRETKVRLRQPDTAQAILKHSPSGKVPLLRDGALAIWDSLAICDYIADLRPDQNLWPRDRARRAVARSIAAEMHAGFPDLRRELPMDIASELPAPVLSDGTRRDVDRIQDIWRRCRAEAEGGPFLFGAFTIADAFYAPVASRFVTYGIELDDTAAAYRDSIMALSAMQDWRRDAVAEEKETP